MDDIGDTPQLSKDDANDAPNSLLQPLKELIPVPAGITVTHQQHSEYGGNQSCRGDDDDAKIAQP